MKLSALWVPVLLLAAGCSGSGDEAIEFPPDPPPTATPAIDSSPFPESAPQGGDMSIQDGSTVTMHFTMTSNGEVLQSTRTAEPFTYVQGQDQMFPAIESELVGLAVGDKKEVTLEPAQAFGDVDPSAVQQVPRSGFQDPSTLEVGGEVRGQVQGQEFRATVKAIDDETVTLDLNHPLAGKTLTFDMEIVAIQ